MTAARTFKVGERQVTRIGLGTNRVTDTPANREFLAAAAATELTMIDTAALYRGGESERTIGATLAPFPEDLLVATEGGFEPGGGNPERLHAELEQSFQRLRTETIALYYLHRVDPETPLEESLGVIEEYRSAGRIEHVGISDVSVEQIESARAVTPIAAVQNEYNLAQRKWDEVVDYCERNEILFVPYYPLRGDPPGLAEIARRHDATPQQIALAWLLKRSPAMLPIPGTRNLDHLRGNLGALDIDLSDDDYAALATA